MGSSSFLILKKFLPYCLRPFTKRFCDRTNKTGCQQSKAIRNQQKTATATRIPTAGLRRPGPARGSQATHLAGREASSPAGSPPPGPQECAGEGAATPRRTAPGSRACPTTSGRSHPSPRRTVRAPPSAPRSASDSPAARPWHFHFVPLVRAIPSPARSSGPPAGSSAAEPGSRHGATEPGPSEAACLSLGGSTKRRAAAAGCSACDRGGAARRGARGWGCRRCRGRRLSAVRRAQLGHGRLQKAAWIAAPPAAGTQCSPAPRPRPDPGRAAGASRRALDLGLSNLRAAKHRNFAETVPARKGRFLGC